MDSSVFFALLHSIGLTHKKLRLLRRENVQYYYENISVSDLIEAGYGVDTASRIVDKKTEKLVEDVYNVIVKNNIRVVHRDDSEYPSLLATIPNAPTILYVRGQLPPNDALISVVGSRKHSQYSSDCLAKILPELIRSGYGIVSGGAYGIDSIAHEITLKNKGYTAVVFGSGVDVVYPPSNRRLFDEVVASGGALISQFPLGTPAEPYNFPIRNEVVASMSRGTLIAEAGEDSGTLITARLALEANRDVFVIPADMTRSSALGSNRLIRDGLGKLITEANDILGEYQIVDKQLSLLAQKPVFTDALQESLYELLCLDALGIDMISERLQVEPMLVINALSLMEIDGVVTSQRGVYRVI